MGSLKKSIPKVGDGSVLRFEDFKLTIRTTGALTSNIRPPIAEIKIILKENAIPMMRVTVDPVHNYKDKGDKATIVGSIQPLSESLLAYQEYANQRLRVNLDLQIRNAKGIEQELKIRNWVLTAAGLTSLSTAGNVAIELEIQHPLILADSASMNLGTFIRRPKDWAAENYDNIVEGFAAAINTYAEDDLVSSTPPDVPDCAEEIIEGGTIKDLEPALRARLRYAADSLNNHLKWDTSSVDGVDYEEWPVCGDCLAGDYEDSIKFGLTDYVTSRIDMSPWDIFSRNIVEAFSLSIIPTYWENELEVTPFSPWAPYRMIIDEREIHDIRLPGTDTAPIIGAMLMYQGAVGGGKYTVMEWSGVAGDADKNPTYIAYLPEKVLEEAKDLPSATATDASVTTGKLFQAEAPGWLSQLPTRFAAKEAGKMEFTEQEKRDQLDAPASLGSYSRPPSDSAQDYQLGSEALHGGLYFYAKEVFLRMYRTQVRTTLSTRLMLQSPGSDLPEGYVIPGIVARIKSVPGNVLARVVDLVTEESSLFDFYIDTVVHSISRQRGEAHTEIAGRYVRSSDATVEENMAASGMYNPLYES